MCFSEVLNYLRIGILLVDKKCNLQSTLINLGIFELGTDRLPVYPKCISYKILWTKSLAFRAPSRGGFLRPGRPRQDHRQKEGTERVRSRWRKHNQGFFYSTTKCVVVSRKEGSKSIEIAVTPRENRHFLLRHLQQNYPCVVRGPTFLFPQRSTLKLEFCRACKQCAGDARNKYACSSQYHKCVCSSGTAMLKGIESILESHGYALDQSPEKALSPAGLKATSWMFVKREG